MDSYTITNEVRAYLTRERISVAQAAARLGVTPSAVTNQLNGRPFSIKMARRYAAAFGFDLDYLTKGEGTLLTSDAPAAAAAGVVPLVPFAARGGSLLDYADGATEQDCEVIASPIRGADLAMEVTGDSMAPDYPSGSRVLLKRVDSEVFVEWGECYVLDTINGPVLKRVMATEQASVVECRSINPDFAPFRVATENIRGWYRVLMVMALK